jgi:putative heme transporter
MRTPATQVSAAPPPAVAPDATPREPLTKPARRIVRFELSPRTLMIVIAVVTVLWMVLHLLPVLLVLVVALMLVGALNPLVDWLERKRVRRNVAIAIVFTAAVGLTVGLLFLIVPPLIAELKRLIEHEPEIRSRAVHYLEESPLTSALADQLRDLHYDEVLKSSRATLLAISARAIEVLAYTVGAIFLALYIMIDRDRLRGAVFAVVPRKHHVRLSRVMLNLETIVGGYIRGQVITCALMTAFILVVLLACHVPNALAIAVFGGIMDVLPYIGVFLTMGPAVIAAYSQGLGIAIIVFGLLLVYEEFESRVLVPWVYGRALRLPSSVVFFSLLVGAGVGGVVGALLALPIAAAVLMLIEELRVELPGEAAQPEDVAIRLKDAREEQEYETRTERAPAMEAAAVAVEIARERRDEEVQEEKNGETKKPRDAPR